MTDIFDEIFKERARQHKLWGEQNHSPAEWMPILMEEVGEVAHAVCERDMANYREELIQVAAVCVQMIQAHDR